MIASRKKFFVGIAFTLFILAAVPLVSAAPVKISDSNSTSVSSNPRLAASGSYVYAVWQGGVKGGIVASVSSNNGATWRTPFGLASASSQEPHIAASGANVYVTWSQLFRHGNREVMFSVSHDNGASWRSVTDLSTDSSKDYSSRILASGNDVFVSWIQSTGRTGQVMFVASHNGGSTWSSPIILSHDGGLSKNVAIVIRPGAVYIAWQDNATGNSQVYFSTSLNDGERFSSPVNLSKDSGSAVQPSIGAAVDNLGANVFAAWTDNTSGTNQIMFKVSHNDGATWSGATKLSNSQGGSTGPNLVASANGAQSSVDVVWTGTNGGNSVIVESTSTNTGARFNGANTVSQVVGNSTQPRIALRAGTSQVSIVWLGASPKGGTDVYTSKSTTYGQSWSTPIDFSNDGHASQARLTDDGSSGPDVYVIWTDSTLGTSSILSAVI